MIKSVLSRISTQTRHCSLKAVGGLVLGIACMFPSFSVVASDQLLENFQYSSSPTTVSQNQAYALIQKNGAVVIDVRTQEEYDAGHIEGAYLFTLDKLSTYPELAVLKEKDTPVLIYCRSGKRAGNATMELSKMGYKYLMNMGGVLTWEYGLTTDKPTRSFTEAVKAVTPITAK